jgi:NAD(P)-dependent dehydrogenase (short-subunit alcohol dehydrogenase family)
MMYGLTRTLKNEIVHIAPRARVNCVAPGWVRRSRQLAEGYWVDRAQVRTPMTEDALNDPAVVYLALATCVSSHFHGPIC